MKEKDKINVNSSEKNKKNIIIGIIIVGVIIIGVIYIIMYFTHDKKNTQEKELSFFNKFIIESTKNKPIKKGNIEAKKIEILHENGNIEITTTLKNISKKPIEGFFIIIELYDEKNKQVTSFAADIDDKIESQQEYELKNFATINKKVKIVSAKITKLEGYSKKTIDNNLNAIKEEIKQ